MSPAATTVLSTYELIEQILVHLPLHDLFILQRVSSSWQKMIKRSSPIRQKMFLLPKDTPLSLRGTELTGRELYQSPGLSLQLNPGYAARDVHADEIPERSGHRLLGSFQVSYTADLFIIYTCTFEMDKHFLPETPHESINHPDASWRSMLLTQPPVTIISITFSTSISRPAVVYNPAGITVGDLQELFASTRARAAVESDRQDRIACFMLRFERDVTLSIEGSHENGSLIRIN